MPYGLGFSNAMLRTLFVLGILIPGFFAAIGSRFFGLIVYIWFALFRPQDWLWIDIERLRLSLVLGSLVALPRPWMGRISKSLQHLDLGERSWPNVTHPLSIGALAFLGTALVAQTNAINPTTGWLWIDYLWRVLLISLLAVGLMSTPKRLTLVLAIAAGSVGFHATTGAIHGVLEGGARYYNGIGGTFSDNNLYAVAIVMTVYLAIAAIQNADNRWIRLALTATVPGSVITLIFTYSRGGFLALAASGFVFLMLQKRRSVWVSLIAPVVLVGVLFIPKDYTERLQTIQTYEEVGEDSALSRLHFWQVAIRMVGNHPMGVGLKNYESAYDRYDFSFGRYGSSRAVHSSYFQVLAELGYLGLALFVGMFVMSFIIAFRVRHISKDPRLPNEQRHFFFTTANALIASMVGFLVGGMFLSMALNDLTWLIFAVITSFDQLSRHAVRIAVENKTTPVDRRTEVLGHQSGGLRHQTSGLHHEFKGGRAAHVA